MSIRKGNKMLDIVYMQMCTSIDGPMSKDVGGYLQAGLFSERDWPTCSCPAYKYSKATINFGGCMVKPECKHIKQAQESVCGWHQQYSSEIQNHEQKEKNICPRCGGSTVDVRVAV